MDNTLSEYLPQYSWNTYQGILGILPNRYSEYFQTGIRNTFKPVLGIPTKVFSEYQPRYSRCLNVFLWTYFLGVVFGCIRWVISKINIKNENIKVFLYAEISNLFFIYISMYIYIYSDWCIDFIWFLISILILID